MCIVWSACVYTSRSPLASYFKVPYNAVPLWLLQVGVHKGIAQGFLLGITSKPLFDWRIQGSSLHFYCALYTMNHPSPSTEQNSGSTGGWVLKKPSKFCTHSLLKKHNENLVVQLLHWVVAPFRSSCNVLSIPLKVRRTKMTIPP